MRKLEISEEFTSMIKFHISIGYWTVDDAVHYIDGIKNEILIWSRERKERRVNDGGDLPQV